MPWLKTSTNKIILCILCSVVLLISCTNGNQASESILNEFEQERKKTSDFETYWYANEAEITSYSLKQARYGELREGTAVLVFVTEPFLHNEQVKADQHNEDNIPVLKLNTTKKYTTGIYPYSIMTSTFFPVTGKSHAVKVSNSVQEWCGQVYAQLNNKNRYEVVSHSYFEGEADDDYSLPKTILEDELWLLLRTNPSYLPVGSFKVIPSLEFTRLKHIALQPYQASLSKTESTFTITYPELERTLIINFMPEFPYEITGWEETFKSGFGAKAKNITSTAKRLTTIKTTYWEQNAKKYEYLRDSLGL